MDHGNPLSNHYRMSLCKYSNKWKFIQSPFLFSSVQSKAQGSAATPIVTRSVCLYTCACHCHLLFYAWYLRPLRWLLDDHSLQVLTLLDLGLDLLNDGAEVGSILQTVRMLLSSVNARTGQSHTSSGLVCWSLGSSWCASEHLNFN